MYTYIYIYIVYLYFVYYIFNIFDLSFLFQITVSSNVGDAQLIETIHENERPQGIISLKFSLCISKKRVSAKNMFNI